MADKTRSSQTQQIASLLADNTNGDISALDLRTVTADLVDSSVNRLDETGVTGRAVLAAPTPSAARTAMSLGDSSTKNVGAAAGSVAAGDHDHNGVYAAETANPVYDTISLRFGASVYKGEIVSVTAEGLPVIDWNKQ